MENEVKEIVAIQSKNIFAVWKPKGISSFGVVEEVRRLTGEKRVGHAGTLDPLAEGILVIGVGREATKRLQEEEAKEKEYRAVIMLGAKSTTDDDEGEKTAIAVDAPPDIERIEKTVKEFVGEIEQTPPAFSAVHVGGKRAYALARRGKEVQLEPRKVFIKEIEVISYAWPQLKLRAVTGKGLRCQRHFNGFKRTLGPYSRISFLIERVPQKRDEREICSCGYKAVYIRSLARDIGERLGVGGYVRELVRTRVGEWTKENAVSLETFKENLQKQNKS